MIQNWWQNWPYASQHKNCCHKRWLRILTSNWFNCSEVAAVCTSEPQEIRFCPVSLEGCGTLLRCFREQRARGSRHWLFDAVLNVKEVFLCARISNQCFHQKHCTRKERKHLHRLVSLFFQCMIRKANSNTGRCNVIWWQCSVGTCFSWVV